MVDKNMEDKKSKKSSYTIGDAVQIADDIFKLSKEKEYNVGAFVHGLIFALEYAQISYQIPNQQLANIKRDSRKYLKQINNTKK